MYEAQHGYKRYWCVVKIKHCDQVIYPTD